MTNDKKCLKESVDREGGRAGITFIYFEVLNITVLWAFLLVQAANRTFIGTRLQMGPVICNNFTVKWHFEPLFTSSRISTCFNLAIIDNTAAFGHFFYSIVISSSEASLAKRKSEAYYSSQMEIFHK